MRLQANPHHVQRGAHKSASTNAAGAGAGGSTSSNGHELTPSQRAASLSFGHTESAQVTVLDTETGEWETKPVRVQLARGPFEWGSTYRCFRLKHVNADTSHLSNQLLVAKFFELTAAPSGVDAVAATEAALRAEVRCRGELVKHATRFNACEPPQHVEVEMASLLQFLERDGRPMALVEPMLTGGPFFKHSNVDCTYLSQRQTPQAFSHFCWDNSGGTMACVHVEGVDNRFVGFCLHTEQQGLTGHPRNNGRAGIKAFLKSHTCNGCCLAVGLPRMANGKKAQSWTKGQRDAVRAAIKPSSKCKRVPTDRHNPILHADGTGMSSKGSTPAPESPPESTLPLLSAHGAAAAADVEHKATVLGTTDITGGRWSCDNGMRAEVREVEENANATVFESPESSPQPKQSSMKNPSESVEPSQSNIARFHDFSGSTVLDEALPPASSSPPSTTVVGADVSVDTAVVGAAAGARPPPLPRGPKHSPPPSMTMSHVVQSRLTPPSSHSSHGTPVSTAVSHESVPRAVVTSEGRALLSRIQQLERHTMDYMVAVGVMPSEDDWSSLGLRGDEHITVFASATSSASTTKANTPRGTPPEPSPSTHGMLI